MDTPDVSPEVPQPTKMQLVEEGRVSRRLSDQELIRLDDSDLKHMRARLEKYRGTWSREATAYLEALLAKLGA